MKTPLACLALLWASADLHVGPGQPFAQVNPAIAAAQPGDRILVGPGSYEAFTLTKPVEVRGAGAGVTKIGTFTSSTFTVVSGIPAGTTATLADLSFDPAWFMTLTLEPQVTVEGNAGTVVLRNILCNQAPTAQHTGAAVFVKESARVLIQGSTLAGYDNPGFGSYGEAGLVAVNSMLDVTDTRLLADPATDSFGFPGPAGAVLIDCTARFARVEATGGAASSGAGFLDQGGAGVRLQNSTLVVAGGPGNKLTGATSPGKGGAGLELVTGSTATLAPDVVLQGAVHGDGSGQAPGLGTDATSSATTLPINLPALVPSVPLAPLGSLLRLKHSGEPGALVVPVLSGQLGPALQLPGFGGLVHLDAVSLQAWPAVVLDAAGLGSTLVPVPALSSLAGAHAWFQAAQVTAGALELSNPTRVEVEL